MDKNISKKIAREYSFEDIKEAYQIKRGQERMKIIDLLRKQSNDENELLVFSSGGYGSSKYKGGSKDTNYELSRVPYDLRNWIYIEGSYKYERKYWHFIINLQCLDQDQEKLNRHVLLDRIGVMIDEIAESEHNNAKKKGDKIEDDCFKGYSHQTYTIEDWGKSLTEVNLPLNDVNSKQLISELFSEKHRISSLNLDAK